MHQYLEVKILTTLVLHLERRLQTLLGQSNAIYQPEVVRPCLLEIFCEHGAGETEVQLDRAISAAILA